MVDRRVKSSQQGLRTPTIGNDHHNASPRKRSTSSKVHPPPTSNTGTATATATATASPSSSASPLLPIHFLPTPLSLPSAPSIATTNSASAASAAASAAGYSPTTSSAPGHAQFAHYPPAFAAKPPPPYSHSQAQSATDALAFASPLAAAGASGKSKGKAGASSKYGSYQVEDEKGQLGCGEGYSALGYGYEGLVPLNDVYGYRRDEKYTSIHPPAANAGAEVKADEDGNGMAAATLAPAHFDIIYANQRQQNQHPHQYQHRRAVSDAAGTTFSCPADFNFAYHHGGGGDGDSDHAKGNGNGNGEAFPGGPSQHTAWHPSTGQVESGSVAEAEYEREVDVMDSASNAPFRSSVAGAAAAAATAERDNGTYTPRSPYRPGEYSYASLRRSTRGGVSYSERTSSRIERKLFRSSRDDVDGDEEHEQEQEQEQPKRNRGSSPLQPPFEARLFLRAGASVDVISWLRKNFHYIPSAAHSVLTPSTSLLAIRALIAERFPRMPEPEELIKAVTVAFPRSSWDYPANASEPPMLRGLVWNGKELDVYDEDEEEGGEDGVADGVQTPEQKGKGRGNSSSAKGRNGNGNGNGKGASGSGAEAQYWRDHHAQLKNKRNVQAAAASSARAADAPVTRNAARSSNTNAHGLLAPAIVTSSNGLGNGDRHGNGGHKTNSPPQSSFESPSSKSHLRRSQNGGNGTGNAPATPARSVLDDFAELATLADQTPNSKAQSLPGVNASASATASAPGLPTRMGHNNGVVPSSTSAPARALASICDSFGGNASAQQHQQQYQYQGQMFGGDIVPPSGMATARGKKRKSMGVHSRARESSPDKLSDLLAAAQAVDADATANANADAEHANGSMNGLNPGGPYMMRRNSSGNGSASGTGHKRRRTIGGMGPGMREMLDLDAHQPPPAWAHRPYGAMFGQVVPMSRSGSAAGAAAAAAAAAVAGSSSSSSAQQQQQQQQQPLPYGRWANGRDYGHNTPQAWARQLASLPELDTPKKDRSAARVTNNGQVQGEGGAEEETGSTSDVDDAVVRGQFALDTDREGEGEKGAGGLSTSASQASLAVPLAGARGGVNPNGGASSGKVGGPKEKGQGRKKAAAAVAAANGNGASMSGSVAPADSTSASVHTHGIHPPSLASASASASPLDTLDAAAGVPAGHYPPAPQPIYTKEMRAAMPNKRSRKANELPTEGDAPGIDCKPPYPYHEMIRHAIQEAPDCRLQLSQIYSNIAERFPFFKTLDEKKTAGWQNSIRHNLSLKKMFVRVGKVDGVPDEGGKGGWWTVKMGVPDEGRPGRKGKGKRRSDADSEGIGAGAEQDGSAVGPALLSLGHKGHGQGQGQGQGELQGQDPSMGHGHGDAQAQGPVAVPTAHVGANVQ